MLHKQTIIQLELTKLIEVQSTQHTGIGIQLDRTSTTSLDRTSPLSAMIEYHQRLSSEYTGEECRLVWFPVLVDITHSNTRR
jgi:hypothetical protein